MKQLLKRNDEIADSDSKDRMFKLLYCMFIHCCMHDCFVYSLTGFFSLVRLGRRTDIDKKVSPYSLDSLAHHNAVARRDPQRIEQFVVVVVVVVVVAH